jgi:hypothetical protein
MLMLFDYIDVSDTKHLLSSTNNWHLSSILVLDYLSCGIAYSRVEKDRNPVNGFHENLSCIPRDSQLRSRQNTWKLSVGSHFYF